MKSSAIRIGVLVVLAVVVIAAIAILPTKEYLLQFVEAVQQMGSTGPVVLAAVYVVATVLFVPGSILTLGAGFLWGVPIGIVTISVGSTLGAAAAFGLGRTLLRDVIAAKVAKNEKFRLIDAAVGEQGFKIVLLTRLSPVFPFNLLNYSFGLTRVSFRDYILASWIGMLPGTAMYVYIGSALKSLADLSTGNYDGGLGQKLLFGFGLVMTVVVTVFITRIAQKSLRDALPAGAPTENHEAQHSSDQSSAEGDPPVV
jgi:uncharacterized membrane protein YdjX (TVP38/TMEM64 family)